MLQRSASLTGGGIQWAKESVWCMEIDSRPCMDDFFLSEIYSSFHQSLLFKLHVLISVTCFQDVGVLHEDGASETPKLQVSQVWDLCLCSSWSMKKIQNEVPLIITGLKLKKN